MTGTPSAQPSPKEWQAALKRYTTPNERLSTRQLVSSFSLYAGTWVIIAAWSSAPLAAQIGLVLFASLAISRLYSLFHDLAHGSLYGSRRTNGIIGTLIGFTVFTSFHGWRHEHNLHHASSGNLDDRGPGDIWTYSVREYRAWPAWKRGLYHAYRTPATILLLGPVVSFLIARRVPKSNANRKVRTGVYATNAFMVAWIVVFGQLMGWTTFVLTQGGILLVGGMIGAWILFVQHNYEETYYDSGDSWDFVAAAIRGSSFLDLPRPLPWFTADIGYHHVHHLSARVPNYHLRAAHDALPLFAEATRMTIWDGMRAFRLKLWDEDAERMITWRELRNHDQTAEPGKARIEGVADALELTPQRQPG